jgi:ssDNA-binding Zn-finger/Zn-ribbon topoisomerase 1
MLLKLKKSLPELTYSVLIAIFNCKNTFSLPPKGIIKKTDKTCEECNYPLLIRLTKGKSPWIFCFNPECVKNKERVEKYRESLGKENQEKTEETDA